MPEYGANYFLHGEATGESHYPCYTDDIMGGYFRRCAQFIAVTLFGLNCQSGNILDIGCARGFIAHYVQGVLPRANVWGQDISHWAIYRGATNILPRLKCGPAQTLYFPPQYFNAVYSLDTLEHIDEDEVPQVMREIYRVLKPQGIAIHYIATQKGEDTEDIGDPSHVTIRPAEWWRKQFRQAGFVKHEAQTWVRATAHYLGFLPKQVFVLQGGS